MPKRTCTDRITGMPLDYGLLIQESFFILSPKKLRTCKKLPVWYNKNTNKQSEAWPMNEVLYWKSSRKAVLTTGLTTIVFLRRCLKVRTIANLLLISDPILSRTDTGRKLPKAIPRQPESFWSILKAMIFSALTQSVTNWSLITLFQTNAIIWASVPYRQ